MRSSEPFSDHMLMQWSQDSFFGTWQWPASCGCNVSTFPGWQTRWSFVIWRKSSWALLWHPVSLTITVTLQHRAPGGDCLWRLVEATHTSKPQSKLSWGNEQIFDELVVLHFLTIVINPDIIASMTCGSPNTSHIILFSSNYSVHFVKIFPC